MDEAKLIYEFDFENENQRDDWGLMCSKCKAGLYCDGVEQVNYFKSITFYCYSCGARFINTGKK